MDSTKLCINAISKRTIRYASFHFQSFFAYRDAFTLFSQRYVHAIYFTMLTILAFTTICMLYDTVFDSMAAPTFHE